MPLRLLASLCLIWALTTVRAEYGAYHLKIEIETKANENIQAYLFLPDYIYESIDSDDDRLWEDEHYENLRLAIGENGLRVYKERLRYAYPPLFESGGDKPHMYQLFSDTCIALADIKSIRTLEQERGSTMLDLWGAASASDSTWTQKKVVDQFNIEGYLCFHRIFVHEATENWAKIRSKLEALEKRIEEEHHAGRSSDALDDMVYELLEELRSERIMILTECSC